MRFFYLVVLTISFTMSAFAAGITWSTSNFYGGAGEVSVLAVHYDPVGNNIVFKGSDGFKYYMKYETEVEQYPGVYSKISESEAKAILSLLLCAKEFGKKISIAYYSDYVGDSRYFTNIILK